jgi:pSer/pThr/pTyr-binding forkhead associated (FHA) protein
MTFNLIVAPVNEEPVQYELNAKRIGVGRSADNQIQLDFDMVSSSHCEIRRGGEEGTWFIEDVGSKNGTRVNGRAVLEVKQLHDGDRLLVAESIPCHFVALPEGEEYTEGVSEGGDPVGVSEYVKLNDKIQELEQSIIAKTLEAETLEGHLVRLRGEFETKKSEYEALFESIQSLQKKIEEGTASGDEEIVGELQSELAEKTQRITLLKSDIAGREAAIDDLEQTRKTALKAEPAAPEAPKPPAPTPPLAPAVAAPKPSTPAGVAPAPARPQVAPPKKPSDLPLAKPAKPGDL